MNKRLQASIRAMTEAQAKAYYARLLAENKSVESKIRNERDGQ